MKVALNILTADKPMALKYWTKDYKVHIKHLNPK